MIYSRITLGICILTLCGSLALYAYSATAVYTRMSTPAPLADLAQETKGKSSTIRTQEKIEALFLKQDNVARVFDMITDVGTAHNTRITVVSVTNAQNGGKAKDLPYTSIDIKLSLKGTLDSMLDSLRALEQLPTLSRVLETSITEDKINAQTPVVDATVRFFMSN
jgi:hypothetical protein